MLPTDVMDMEVNWLEEQGKDKTVARVINIITTKQHVNARAETKEVLKLLRKRRKLLLIDNILCRIIYGKSAVQIVVPTHLRQLVMNKFYNDSDHSDQLKTWISCKCSFFWPGMQNMIETHVGSCTTCSSNTHSSSEDTSTEYDLELSDDDDDTCKVGISLRPLHKHWHARMLQVHYPEYID